MTYYTPVDRQAQEVIKHLEAMGVVKGHERKRAKDPITTLVDLFLDWLERFITIKVNQVLRDKKEQMKLFDKSLYH